MVRHCRLWQGQHRYHPAESTGYEAPIISDLKYVQPGEGDVTGYLTYIQATPQQVWEAGIYYEMTGVGNFCPEPLGPGIFIWLAILLAVTVLFIALIRKKKQKKQ